MCITPPRWALPTPLHARPLGAEVTKNQRPEELADQRGKRLRKWEPADRAECLFTARPWQADPRGPPAPPTRDWGEACFEAGSGIPSAQGAHEPAPGGLQASLCPQAGPAKHLALEICPGGPRAHGPRSPGGRSQADSAHGVGQAGSHTPRAPCCAAPSGPRAPAPPSMTPFPLQD